MSQSLLAEAGTQFPAASIAIEITPLTRCSPVRLPAATEPHTAREDRMKAYLDKEKKSLRDQREASLKVQEWYDRRNETPSPSTSKTAADTLAAEVTRR
jgi:hypothetical protein